MEQPPTTTVNCGESIDHQNKPNPVIKNKKTMKKNKKKKNNKDLVSSDESSCSNVMSSRSKGVRIAMNRRNLNRKKGGEVDALALPLGMSIAAFVAQVLERKNANGEKMSVDHLSEALQPMGVLKGTYST